MEYRPGGRGRGLPPPSPATCTRVTAASGCRSVVAVTSINEPVTSPAALINVPVGVARPSTYTTLGGDELSTRSKRSPTVTDSCTALTDISASPWGVETIRSMETGATLESFWLGDVHEPHALLSVRSAHEITPKFKTTSSSHQRRVAEPVSTLDQR